MFPTASPASSPARRRKGQQGLGFRVEGLGLRVLGFRVLGLGFRLEGSRLRGFLGIVEGFPILGV